MAASIIDFPTKVKRTEGIRRKANREVEEALWKGKPSSYRFPTMEIDGDAYVIQINAMLEGWIWEAMRVLKDIGEEYMVDGRAVTPKVIARIRVEPSVVYETPAEALQAARSMITGSFRK